MKMKDIRVIHLEETIKNAQVGDSTKGRMKSIFNLMYKYALKHEIVDRIEELHTEMKKIQK